MFPSGGGCGSLVGHSEIATAKKGRRICQRIGTRKEGSAHAFRKASRGRAICAGLCTGNGHNRICAESTERQRGFYPKPQDIRCCSEARSPSRSGRIVHSLLLS